MTVFRAAGAVAACLVFTTSCSPLEQMEAQGSAEPGQVVETEIGPVLATPEGLTLYIYDDDERGVSNCTAECAQVWPPFLASADAEAAGGWSVITREGGARQWAYDGNPLYTWVEDQQPGDLRGVGIPEWQVATP